MARGVIEGSARKCCRELDLLIGIGTERKIHEPSQAPGQTK
jgi:hypothetical protein